MPAPRSFATASSCWPTPNASGVNEEETPETWESRRQLLLHKGINGNGAGMPLGIAAQLWPTPTMQDKERSGSAIYTRASGRHTGMTLTDAAARDLWATPMRRDSKDGASPADRTPTNAFLGRQAPRIWRAGDPTSPRGVLNPRFVEALQGFPLGWTEPDWLRSETPSSPPRPPSPGES